MEVAFSKDLRHNYMIITEEKNSKCEEYSKKIIERLQIDGILSMEQRRMDDKILLFYDITAKQSLSTILEKTALNYNRLKQLFTGIIRAVDKAYEYLLMEDDFVLLPEYIYMDIASTSPFLCYYSGYRKNLLEQTKSLLEFLMNKVDYNDKNAVLLVYQLYAVSREEGFTFDHIHKILETSPGEQVPNKLIHEKAEGICHDTMKNTGSSRVQEPNDIDNRKVILSKAIIDKNNAVDQYKNKEIKLRPAHSIDHEQSIPVVMEKLEDEVEITCYPFKTYLITGGLVLAGIILTVFTFTAKLIYNIYSGSIDYSKLFAVLLIVICTEGYLLSRLWDKKNKITRMVARKKYVDPRLEYRRSTDSIKATSSNEHTKYNPIENQLFKKPKPDYEDIQATRLYNDRSKITKANYIITNRAKTGNKIDNDNIDNIKTLNSMAGATIIDKQNQLNTAEEDNPTCLLNRAEESGVILLKPLDEESYKTIKIKVFPFFIGKLKKNVDYCLENDVVSRYHAKLSKELGKYYITDLNSKNGTYINEEPVQTYEKREIQIGDEIAFADIKYKVEKG